MLFELGLHYMNNVAVQEKKKKNGTAPCLPVHQDVGAGDVICKVVAWTRLCQLSCQSYRESDPTRLTCGLSSHPLPGAFTPTFPSLH